MKKIVFIGIMVLFINCDSTKTFTEQDNQAYQRLKNLVQSKNLEIHSNYAKPMATNAFMQVANTGALGVGNTATNIDISSNSNMLKIKGDSIRGYFPFFGEQQFGGGYPGTNHQGIEFDAIPENYSVTENDAKHSVEIHFKIDDQYRTNEHYNIYITLFPNNRSSVQVMSTNRTSIEYTGTLSATTAEDKKTQ
ncbi:MAG: DUF4251 domain-containing protein [Gelidibacter sp.]